jgi:hypothetical protein
MILTGNFTGRKTGEIEVVVEKPVPPPLCP